MHSKITDTVVACPLDSTDWLKTIAIIFACVDHIDLFLIENGSCISYAVKRRSSDAIMIATRRVRFCSVDASVVRVTEQWHR